MLLAFYLAIVLPLSFLSGQIRKHINLMLFGIVPILLSFILLYIVVLKGVNGGWNFIALKILKLVLYTSMLQFCLLIPSENLISTFKMWGLKGETLITVLGAFTVWADVSYRAEKIITARFSRGFIEKRTFFSKAKQFPFVLVPLFIGILRTSTERAESWEQKDILHLVQNFKPEKVNYPAFLNSLLFAVSIGWVLVGLIYKINT